MDTIAHRDLRNRSSEILRQVAAGASYAITNHGEVVAVIGPPGDRPDTGGLRLHPAARCDVEVPTHRSPLRTADVLDELRAER